MPLSQNSQQAILAAYGRLTSGAGLSTGDTAFWRHFGLPPWRQRQLIIDRAEALQTGARDLVSGQVAGSLSDIYANTDYQRCGGRCGPAETETATVRGRVWFRDQAGHWTMRTYDKTFSWDTTTDTINRSVRSWITAMARKYGLSSPYDDLSQPLQLMEQFMVY